MKKLHIFYMLFAIILCSLISCGQKSNNQEFLNLAFSEVNNGKPAHWFWGDIGYQLELKAQTDGNFLEMKDNQPKDDDFGMILNHIPINSIKGKTVKVTALIQTTNLTNGYAGLWCGINQSWGPISIDEWKNNAIKENTASPQLISVEMKIDESANEFHFAGVFNGKGQATFSQFTIYIDGEKYVDTQVEQLTEKQMTWLRNNIHPLKTSDPKATDNDDLKILDNMIGNSKVVALGEVTHGVKEIFDMKHRIVRHLAKEKGYDVFSLEANLPESYAINENYVTNGKGNTNEHLASLYFWTWHTQEVKNMLDWMKNYKHEGGKIQFTGFDMQVAEGALKNLEEAFAHDTSTKKTIKSIREGVKTFREDAKNSMGAKIDETNRQNTLKALGETSARIERSNVKNKEWLLINCNIISQSLDISNEKRDQYMAENFLWIMKQNPNSKFTIWGHNIHISKEEPWMGSHLDKSLGKDYVNIGFVFYEGSYSALGNNGLNTYDAQTAYLGTLEYYLNSIAEPLFIMDMRKAREDQSPEAQWIKSQLRYRTVGAMKMDEEFGAFNINAYDLLIFINKANASELLPRE